jgi:hypothetical protein
MWRLGLWCWFLWCTARRRLHLVPTHPDSAGGLGYLEVVHTHFVPVIVAISAVQAASIAEDLVLGTAPFDSIYPAFALVVLVVAVLFLGPLFVFAPKIWGCRVQGHSDYMELADRYVSGFDRKWVRSAGSPHEELLGTGDIQSLADLNNSLGVIKEMRSVPISIRLISDFTLATLIPMLPLFLLKYPIDELARKFLSRMAGL